MNNENETENKYGNTALMKASGKGHLGIVKELEKVNMNIENNENTETKETTEKIITKERAERYKSDLAILKKRIKSARHSIAQAEKQYKNSIAKIERQKERAFRAQEAIAFVKVRVANQLVQAQHYQELLAEYEKQEKKEKDLI